MLFKLLNEDGSPAHGGSGRWPLPAKLPDGSYSPGEWLEVEGDIVPCYNGLHLCRFKNVLDWSAPCMYVAEFAPGAEVIDEGDKLVGRKARLLYPVEAWNERVLRIFATRCVRRVWHLLDDERSKTAVQVARRYADGNVTRDELDAVWDAACDAACDAARDTACGAACGATMDAARSAARDAARDVARDAARSVAWGAARVAACGAARNAAKSVAWGAACGAARGAARSIAWVAEIDWQVSHLAWMLGLKENA
jgi:hypothetical protein